MHVGLKKLSPRPTPSNIRIKDGDGVPANSIVHEKQLVFSFFATQLQGYKVNFEELINTDRTITSPIDPLDVVNINHVDVIKYIPSLTRVISFMRGSNKFKAFREDRLSGCLFAQHFDILAKVFYPLILNLM